MISIAVQGIYGRMGRALLELVGERSDCAITAGVDKAAGAALPFPVVLSVEGLDTLEARPDVLIDFSHPEATEKALEYCAVRGLPCVVCTTGLNDGVLARLREASAKTPVFHSANMSLGINLLLRLIKRAQAVLDGFDVEIIEKHHHNKLDAPSGTALMLADALNEGAGGRYEYVYDRHAVRQKRKENELGIHAVRGGSIVGEHEVLFAGPDEVVSLSHTAYSRGVFATGAIQAALFLAKCGPGLYSMDNLLEEK